MKVQASRGLLVHSLPRDVISIRKSWKLKLWQLALTHGNANIYLLITCWDNVRQPLQPAWGHLSSLILYPLYHIPGHTSLSVLSTHSIHSSSEVPNSLVQTEPGSTITLSLPQLNKTQKLLKTAVLGGQFFTPYYGSSLPFSFHKESGCWPRASLSSHKTETQRYTQSLKSGNRPEKSICARLFAIRYSIDNFSIVLKP